MKNITLAVEDETLVRMREFAERNGTTVNALVRRYFADTLDQEQRMVVSKRRLKELMDNSTGRLGPDYKWNRDEVYADRMFPRHERPDLRGDGEEQ